MAEQGLFVETLEGNPVNVTLIQTIFIDSNDSTNIIWYFKNGETYEEDLSTEEEAEERFSALKKLLLGTSIAELEEIISQQQSTISEQSDEIDALNNNMDEFAEMSKDILGNS